MKKVVFIMMALPMAAVAATGFVATDDWTLKVTTDDGRAVSLQIEPQELWRVEGEEMELKEWRPDFWEQARGSKPKAILCQECTAENCLVPSSVKVLAPDGKVTKRGVDWQVDENSGVIGYLKGGAFSAPSNKAFVSYSYQPMRIDAIIDDDGVIKTVRGVAKVGNPEMPEVGAAKFLGSVFLYSGITRLDDKSLYPKLEDKKELPRMAVGDLALKCPKTYEKLINGDKVRILAWGDSVTEGRYLDNKDERWQIQFLKRLRARYPKAEIELESNGWGGRQSRSFMSAPASDVEHHYETAVLGRNVDLVISEFINDTGMDDKTLEDTYGRVLRDLRSRGIEWIICSPHYSKPSWMNSPRFLKCDEDTRHLVKWQRAFAARHDIAHVEPGRRWGHLWREGIPYLPLLVNNINHPNAFGLSFYADALMDLFDVPPKGVNPRFVGWYADPQLRVYGDTYWAFPTYSHRFEEQTFMNCFSSKDLVNWTRHERIISTNEVKWAHYAMWAPDAHFKDGKYYLFFAANETRPVENDITTDIGKLQAMPKLTTRQFGDYKYGGIGVAVADKPEGPYRDLIGKPLIDQFWNKSQPIDQYAFEYNGEWYMIYGGWGRCQIVRLADDFKSLVPFEDGELWHDITPKDYTEGSVMFERKGIWYFMYSSGNWTDSTYRVNYSVAKTPFGPFTFKGAVLTNQPDIAKGAGHHSVFKKIGTEDEWYICYHRRPTAARNGNHRETCIDRMYFDENGDIMPVKMTK